MFKWLGLLLTCFSIMLWAGEDRGLGGTGKTANDDRGQRSQSLAAFG